jgi:hypothetical protein
LQDRGRKDETELVIAGGKEPDQLVTDHHQVITRGAVTMAKDNGGGGASPQIDDAALETSDRFVASFQSLHGEVVSLRWGDCIVDQKDPNRTTIEAGSPSPSRYGFVPVSRRCNRT